MTEEQRLTLSIEDGIAQIRLVRPEAANSIDLAFALDFESAAKICKKVGVRVVLISGEGRHFCAGGDLKNFASSPELDSHLTELVTHLHSGITILVEMDAPLVIAVEGAVAGAGLGLVCAADIVVSGTSATYVMAYTQIGLSPDGSTTWFLPRLIGLRRALDLTLTNRVLDATEALDWGIVSRLVEDGEALNEARNIAERLAGGPIAAFGKSARLIRSSMANDLETQLNLEATNLVESAQTSDGIEGIRAFIDGRSPHFSNTGKVLGRSEGHTYL